MPVLILYDKCEESIRGHAGLSTEWVPCSGCNCAQVHPCRCPFPSNEGDSSTCECILCEGKSEEKIDNAVQ